MDKSTKLKELHTDWNELESYRHLNGATFCFHGEWITDDSSSNEDAYWEIDQYEIANKIDDLHNLNYKLRKHSKLPKNNYYYNRLYDKEKLKKFQKICSWWALVNKQNKDTGERYLARCYVSRDKRFYKRQSDKQVRKSNEFALNGSGYKRVFGDIMQAVW